MNYILITPFVMGTAQKKLLLMYDSSGYINYLTVGVLLAGSASRLLLLGPALVPTCIGKGEDDTEMHHAYHDSCIHSNADGLACPEGGGVQNTFPTVPSHP